MKIIDIFATQNLFAIHYEDEIHNEYRRLMEFWEDIEALQQFLQSNVQDIPSYKSIHKINSVLNV